jgi:hypothetical protein
MITGSEYVYIAGVKWFLLFPYTASVQLFWCSLEKNTNKQTNNFSLFLAIKGGKDSLSIFTAASFSLWFQAKGWNNY